MTHVVLLACLLLIPHVVFANGESLYVVGSTACTFNGDGTVQTCAASDGAAGAYLGGNNILWNAADTVGQVDPGDTLYLCGTHLITTALLRILPGVSGTAGKPITLSGACPNSPGVLDGQNTGVRLINLEPLDYITVHAVTIQNTGAAGEYALSAYDSDGSGTHDRHLTFTDNIFLNIGSDGLSVRGAYIIATGNSFTNVGGDAFWCKGCGNSNISSNTCHLISMNTVTGDCIQFDSTGIPTGTLTVSDNYCDKRLSPSVKYCLLIGPVTGRTTVERNVALCPISTAIPTGCNPIYINAAGSGSTAEVVVRSNYVSKGYRGITVATADNTAFRHQVIGNVVVDQGDFGIWLDANSDNVDVVNNTLRRNLVYALYLGKVTNTHRIINNIFEANQEGIFYAGNPPGQGESYNDFFGQVGVNIRDGGGSVALAGTDLTADPKFVAANDSRLQATSTLRHAGTTYLNCVDVHGGICQTPPDIGAYQSGSGSPAYPRTPATTRSARQ